MTEGFALTMYDGGLAEPEWEEALAFPSYKKERRPMTTDGALAVKCIRMQVTFSVGHWDKKFMRGLPEEITEKQAAQVWRIFKTYRRQIDTARGWITAEKKREMLATAERLSAPDLRKERREAAQVAQEKARCRNGVAA